MATLTGSSAYKETDGPVSGSENPENPIQVPAYQPTGTARQNDEEISVPQQSDSNEAPMARHNSEIEGSQDKSISELRKKDWKNMEAIFKREMDEAIENEEDLLAEFRKLANAFSYWAQAAGQHDDKRAVKRIKTQERQVQLSEKRVEVKIQHHKAVVDAFTAALEILQGDPTSSKTPTP